ncbi:hypothetical protein XENTR_v10024117 [Xenopus tropicalis]|nr:hypothetical protein XENTR_v10024117 [Xenopus tropicalis]
MRPVVEKAAKKKRTLLNPDMVLQPMNDPPSADDWLGNTKWCFCGNCVPMPTTTESICCKEETAIEIKIPEGGHCVTECQHFETHFTNKVQTDLNLKMLYSNMKKTPKNLNT